MCVYLCVCVFNPMHEKLSWVSSPGGQQSACVFKCVCFCMCIRVSEGLEHSICFSNQNFVKLPLFFFATHNISPYDFIYEGKSDTKTWMQDIFSLVVQNQSHSYFHSNVDSDINQHRHKNPTQEEQQQHHYQQQQHQQQYTLAIFRANHMSRWEIKLPGQGTHFTTSHDAEKKM